MKKLTQPLNQNAASCKVCFIIFLHSFNFGWCKQHYYQPPLLSIGTDGILEESMLNDHISKDLGVHFVGPFASSQHHYLVCWSWIPSDKLHYHTGNSLSYDRCSHHSNPLSQSPRPLFTYRCTEENLNM
ncbi:unnamed protein product, partial [Choristocarpus tenellus]